MNLYIMAHDEPDMRRANLVSPDHPAKQERRDLSCTYLAHHELQIVSIINIDVILRNSISCDMLSISKGVQRYQWRFV